MLRQEKASSSRTGCHFLPKHLPSHAADTLRFSTVSRFQCRAPWRHTSRSSCPSQWSISSLSTHRQLLTLALFPKLLWTLIVLLEFVQPRQWEAQRSPQADRPCSSKTSLHPHPFGRSGFLRDHSLRRFHKLSSKGLVCLAQTCLRLQRQCQALLQLFLPHQ